MAILKVENNLTNDAQRTYSAVNQAVGVGTLYVKNTNGFNGSWGIQVGDTGKEHAEIVVGTNNSGTSAILNGTTLFDHPADTPIYAIKWNQVVFEKSTTGTTGTATPITGGTVTIQPDNYNYKDSSSYTTFDDTAGVSSDAYRTRFRNSTLGSQTAQSDWFVPSGATFYSLQSLTDRVRDKLWNSSFIKDDLTIHNWINEWKDMLTNSIISINEDYALGTVDVAFDGTDGYGTITTTDFSQVRRLWVTYDSSNFYQSTKMNINDFLPDQQFSSVHPYHAWLGNTTFQIRPEESGGTARIVFYRFGTTMVNSTDELPQPMRSYTDSFVNYALAQALFKDNTKLQEYRDKITEANNSKAEFTLNSVPRDKSGPTYVDIVEDISGEDGRVP